jgi:HlyD family secretion protein
MSTTVGILTETRKDIIAVPIQSVTTRLDTTKVVPAADDEIRTLVFLTDGQYALAKDVKTGIQDNNYIEITSGIEAGEQVISAPFTAISRRLSDSTLIEIREREELFREN